MQRSQQHRAVAGTLVLPFLSRPDAPDMFAKFEAWKKPFQRTLETLQSCPFLVLRTSSFTISWPIDLNCNNLALHTGLKQDFRDATKTTCLLRYRYSCSDSISRESVIKYFFVLTQIIKQNIQCKKNIRYSKKIGKQKVYFALRPLRVAKLV